MSRKELTTIEALFLSDRKIVGVRYDGEARAKVKPLKLRLKDGSQAVKSKPRRYPLEKRNFLRRYIIQLKFFGLIDPAARTEWVSCPLITQK